MKPTIFLRNIHLFIIVFFTYLNINSAYSKSFDDINLQINQSEYAKSIYLDNPLSFYPFEGNLMDYANENNSIQRGAQDGTSVAVYYSTPDSFVIAQAGTGSQVLGFRGFGERIEFSRDISKALIDAPAITFETWIRNRDMKNQKIINLYSSGSSSFEVYINSGIIGVAARTQTIDSWENMTIPYNSFDKWHHLVAITDFEQSQIRVYLDGKLVRKQNVSGWVNKSYRCDISGNVDVLGSRHDGSFSFFGFLKNTVIYAHAIDKNTEGIARIKKRFELAGGMKATEVIILGRKSSATRIKYNNPEASFTVNLAAGYGAHPLPLDADGNGVLDMYFTNSDIAHNGLYLAKNMSEKNSTNPLFGVPQYVGPRIGGAKTTHIDGVERILSPGREYTDFKVNGFNKYRTIGGQFDLPIKQNIQWVLVDIDHDGDDDLIISGGIDDMQRWKLYDSNGNWLGGEMHGYIYLSENTGSKNSPVYKTPEQLFAGSQPIDVYGQPTACLADFDNDGDYDIITGEYINKLTYFENIGTPSDLILAEGRLIKTSFGQNIEIDGQMLWLSSIDWNKDGNEDIVVGDENGWIMILENTRKLVNNTPTFKLPNYFQQIPDELKIGSLSAPCGVDWNGDGKQDLICGDSSGRIYFIENLDGGYPPKWNKPVALWAGGMEIHVQAGENGSVQGPCEAKWGYMNVSVTDWDHDGLHDIIANDVWGRVHWYKNIGSYCRPVLAAAQDITVKWDNDIIPKPNWVWWTPQNNQLVTQWRTKPVAYDLNKDGLSDLITLDHEGYLVFFERYLDNGLLKLKAPQRIFKSIDHPWYTWQHYFLRMESSGNELRLNGEALGRSGKRTFVLVDWDLDGKLDLLVNSQSVSFLKNISEEDGGFLFKDMGPVVSEVYAGHNTSPTVVYWSNDGIPDLVFGAEDGCFYFVRNPYR